jgi:hypothetical protein
MDGGGRGFFIGALCILATAVTAAPGVAQTPPAPAAPNPQEQVPGGCDSRKADGPGGSIVQATGESPQRKRWQPEGGVIQFTIRSFVGIPEKASFFVCFRWKTTPENTQNFDQTRPDRLERNNDGTTWTVTTTVPAHLTKEPPGTVRESALPLVPLADVRIVAIKEDKTLAADMTTTIGITYPWAAIFLALATIVIVLIALTIITNLRLTHVGIKKAAWPLRIIATPSGYASLSQLQIVLWTLVVAASAVYVMSLSGDLIEITNGTLVLLGISGAAAVGAKVHSEQQNSAAQSAASTKQQEADKAKIEAAQKTAAVSADPTNQVAITEKAGAERAETDASKKADAANARANALDNPPDTQIPRWSDLIVNETTKADGTVTREIDVARFQMLLFTLITAVFVLMNVLTTYVIPEIPTGFQVLMGISNSVYLGAKVAQGT